MGSRLVLALLMAILVAVPSAALAATMQVGTSTGTKPTPQAGSTVRVKFNPTAIETVLAGDTLETFLQRLTNSINLASAGQYVASHVLDSTVIQILRIDGGEIDDLQFRENDPNIQSTSITVNGNRLVAQIGFIEENPSLAGGTIFLTLNGQTVSVNTTGLANASAVTVALILALQGAGYLVESHPPYFVVKRGPNGSSFTQVGLRSTDSAITTSDVGLLPGPIQAPLTGRWGITVLLALLGLAGALYAMRGRRPAENSTPRATP
jgi:hypothetical protein